MLSERNGYNQRSTDYPIDNIKTTVYRTDTRPAHFSSHSELFPSQDKFITMNDDRRKIERNYSRDFMRTTTQSDLFTNRVKKIHITHEEKPDRSLSRKYKNQSQMKSFDTGLGPVVSIDLNSKGVRKVKNSPQKSERSMSRRHFAPATKTEGNQSAFLVSKVNVDNQCVNKSDTKVIVNLGKKRLLSHVNSHGQLPMPLSERRHYENPSIKNSAIKEILNVGKENGQSSINFGVDFYKRSDRIPEQPKDIKIPQQKYDSSRITHYMKPAERLVRRFKKT